MDNKKLVVGNLKMNLLNAQERERYLQWLDKELKGKKLKNSEIVLCPPFVHLEAFQKFKKTKLGAQDMFPEAKGSYTGEISPVMLKNFGCEYVIIGHSERRRYFSENNHEINLKINAALKNGLKPILCVGETKIEKENHEALRIITQQVTEALSGISRAKAEQIIIAYEPVWAIGSGLVPTANEVMEGKLLIRKILVDLFSKKYAEMVRILYGGSVNTKTVTQVCVEAGMDGALIGRESLLPHEFIKIVQIIDGN
ncbi:MAG: triose-phosphate isomerase [Parcubacteria group bacterium]|jgi:triosephosphate isomerase